jgi:hypothetical protein
MVDIVDAFEIKNDSYRASGEADMVEDKIRLAALSKAVLTNHKNACESIRY